MITMLLQYVLYPYTVFIGLGAYNYDLPLNDQFMGTVLTATFKIEVFIDICWVITMCFSIVMAKDTEDGLEERWSEISKGYMKNDFFFDFLPTVTCFSM